MSILKFRSSLLPVQCYSAVVQSRRGGLLLLAWAQPGRLLSEDFMAHRFLFHPLPLCLRLRVRELHTLNVSSALDLGVSALLPAGFSLRTFFRCLLSVQLWSRFSNPKTLSSRHLFAYLYILSNEACQDGWAPQHLWL